MYGLDYWLPFTDGVGSIVNDVTGNGHDGTISGAGIAAAWPGLAGLNPNQQTVTLPNASGRASFGICAYFPAGRMPNNGAYFYGSAVFGTGEGQNGANLGTSYGPSEGIFHGASAYFPQIGHSNGAAVTLSSDGFSGIHCVEGVAGGSLDHIIVDGAEVHYLSRGSSADTVGGHQLTAPMWIIGGDGLQFGAPVTIYSVWGTSKVDTVSRAASRTSSEVARLRSLGVAFGVAPASATDSSCSIDGTSIDEGFQAGNVRTSSLLNLDFPCTISDFSQSGQPPRDMSAGFQDRAGRVFHPQAPRNIAYHGGVVNGVTRFLEPPEAAFQDVLEWTNKAHALGYRVVVSTMMSACLTVYNGEPGDQLAREYNAKLLANAERFDWVDNLAAWPSLGAANARAGSAFADGIHLNSAAGRPLYVSNERAGFKGVYGTELTTVSASYSQLPSDRAIQANGRSPYKISLLDANSASFNSAGKLCVTNGNTAPVNLVPVAGETVDEAPSLSVPSGATVCIHPFVANAAAAGANWSSH